MNSKTLVGLLVATALVAGVAAVAMSRNESRHQGAAEMQKLFPELGARANDVVALRVQRKDGAYTLRRTDSGWTLEDKGGYPIDSAQVVSTVRQLVDLRPIEAKTSD